MWEFSPHRCCIEMILHQASNVHIAVLHPLLEQSSSRSLCSRSPIPSTVCAHTHTHKWCQRTDCTQQKIGLTGHLFLVSKWLLSRTVWKLIVNHWTVTDLPEVSNGVWQGALSSDVSRHAWVMVYLWRKRVMVSDKAIKLTTRVENFFTFSSLAFLFISFDSVSHISNIFKSGLSAGVLTIMLALM